MTTTDPIRIMISYIPTSVLEQMAKDVPMDSNRWPNILDDLTRRWVNGVSRMWRWEQTDERYSFLNKAHNERNHENTN